MAIEPPLQELSGEELLGATANRDSGARLDIVADGFWGTSRERIYFDVRVFNPYATSNRQSSLSSTYRSHEKEKKRLYLQRIRDVEHSSFSPLVFSSTGGMAKEASIFYKRMASLLSEKHGQTYSTTMAWLRCVPSFSLLRSSILCFRGHRSAVGRPAKTTPLLPVDVIRAESAWSPLN